MGESVEERRAVLKVGDRITDPALLCEGMIVRPGWSSQEPPETTITRRHCNGWLTDGPAGEYYVGDGQVKNPASYMGVAFAGWAASPPASLKVGPLPFKRHHACRRPHPQPVLCTHCEFLIGQENVTPPAADAVDAKHWRSRREPWLSYGNETVGMHGPGVLSRIRDR